MVNRTTLLAIGVLVIVVVAVGVYIYFTLPPSIRIVMKDPPAQAYASTISHIWITFSAIQMHQVRSGHDTWITLNSTSKVTVDLIAILNTTRDLGAFSLPSGNYTEMRFNVSTAVANIASANVTLAISPSPNGLKIPFQGLTNLVLSAAQSATITIDINADNPSLLLGKLSVTMTAKVS